jgi:hypothetical protein
LVNINIDQEVRMPKVLWYWWEVQFDDRRGQPIGDADVYIASVEPLELDEVDKDENGKPVEVTSFVESTVFCVVKTIEDEPLAALKRALSLMQPRILGPREDVQWANIEC